MDYWREHAEIALSEAGLPSATDEQLDAIAGVIESAHEFYGQNMGHDVATANFKGEQQRLMDNLARQLQEERDKVICGTCNGGGEIVTHGPYHSSSSQCWKCNGDGRHKL